MSRAVIAADRLMNAHAHALMNGRNARTHLCRFPSARLSGEAKEGLLKLIDRGPGRRLGPPAGVLGPRRGRRARAPLAGRLREVGTLVDRAPGGVAVHRPLDWEVAAILELIEAWGPVDRSHRKLAHRGSYLRKVFVCPSTLRRVAEKHQVSLPEPARRQPAVTAPWPEWVRWAIRRAREKGLRDARQNRINENRKGKNDDNSDRPEDRP